MQITVSHSYDTAHPSPPVHSLEPFQSCCHRTPALSTDANKPGRHIFYLQDNLCNLPLCRSGDKVFWLLRRVTAG